jgi:hypothetical protein
LSLFDFRKLRRRRKAFERWRQHGISVGGAAGRPTKLREGKRRAQLEAFRFLLLRDGDGSEEGILRWRRVRRVALEENLAADAVQEGLDPMLACLLRQRQGIVDAD